MANNRRQFLKHLAGLSGLAASAVPNLSAAAKTQAAQIHDLRLSKKPDYIRLVFDLNNVAEHSILTLHQPERLVLDIKNTKMPHGMVDRVQANSLIRGIRRSP